MNRVLVQGLGEAGRGGGLEVDTAFEDEVGGTTEAYVLEAVGGGVELDSEQVATLDLDFDGGGEAEASGGHQGAGGDAGTAGEGFAFDTAFIGTDADAAWGEDLDEIDVGAARSEVGMESEASAFFLDLGLVGIGDHDHGMGDAGIEGVDGHRAGLGGDGLVQLQVAGWGEVDGDLVVFEVGGDGTGGGGEGDGFAGGGAEGVLDEAGEAAGSVAAHFRIGTVGVPELPGPGRVSGGMGGEEHEAVGADAELAMAEAGHLFAGGGEQAAAVIGDDEVVTGAGHLGEFEEHGARQRGGQWTNWGARK